MREVTHDGRGGVSGALSAALAASVAALCGTAAGLLVRILGPERTSAERAAAALLVVVAAAPAVAAACTVPAPELARRLRAVAWAAACAWIAGVAATLVAGSGGEALTAALVPAGAAALAAGVGSALGGIGVSPGAAAFAAAAVVAAPAAALFVADPWIEWRGGDAATSPGRAQAVVTVSPVAAACSFRGGVGVDWLRQKLVYDGPAAGVPGLSLIGQYYAVREPSALAWGAVAGLLGLSAACAPRRLRPCSPASSSPSPSA